YAGTYPSSSMPYSVAPGTWSLACPNPPFVSGSAFNIAMNMNSGGDQIYFLQGGTWTNPAGANNATYPNSNVLYGFSSSSAGFTTASLSTPPATGTTNLVPGMECNVMAPSASTDFSYFVPPSPAPTSQAGWIAAINNSANWFPGISCSDYNTTFATQYPAGTLFTGSLPSGLLTAISNVNLCGSTPYTNYDLTQHNAAIIGSAGYASSEIYWYTADPSQGTNASTSIIAAPATYTFNSTPLTLYAAQASTAALSTTKRCNLVAITFTISPYPTLTPVAGTLCYNTNSLLTPITVTNPGGFTVVWYSAAVGGTTLSVGSTYTPSPLPTSTTTYYAEVVSNGCATRVPVPVYLSTCVSNCQATDLDTIPVSCFGVNDGQAVVNFDAVGNPVYFTPNVSATSPLTGGHAYVWNTGATTNPATGLAPGTYTVTVSGTGSIVSMPIAVGDAWTMTPTVGQTGMPQTVNGASPNAWNIGTGESGQAVGTCAGAGA
ncbi:MAG TPA: hypothetical protein PK230_12395, partial [Chitinophagales bacterium]|nr:hypothetical protein [Chitinophagales bacterium]